MQIKITVRYHLTSARMAIINKSTNNNYGEKGTLFLHSRCERGLGQPLWKAVWRYLKKLKFHLLFDPTSGNISDGTQNTNSKEQTTFDTFY